MNVKKLLAGWSFRTSTPDYAVGDELTAFVTGTDGSTPIVRIGDTVIQLPDADGDGELVEKRVRLRVTEFDAQRHEGAGELLSVFDDEE
ncbi:hypothetical protein SAMN04487949_2370 [Halogranum gelatinilyticum]|uniref:DUF7513 domain-containing protein n=1 Tax=Halogranum gelatinilyticum TaxID=660521 RepID=A0A1G9VGL8_9EURY|nr:hypothetical protein [Halogranum gelatinilyticum]SDM71201.1 hypothetical protein SAMN04487949_2370 [Halogranum gelatinilyticum]